MLIALTMEEQCNKISYIFCHYCAVASLQGRSVLQLQIPKNRMGVNISATRRPRTHFFNIRDYEPSVSLIS